MQDRSRFNKVAGCVLSTVIIGIPWCVGVVWIVTTLLRGAGL